MNGLSGLGRFLIIAGFGLIVVGGIIICLSRFINLGKLPGDIFVQKENISFYFPIVSCLVVSIVLTVLLNIFRR